MPQNLVIPTAEPFFLPGGTVGCLLVHGFTGTPKEMRWLGESLNQKGNTVLGIRLAGHATTPEDLLRSRWWDWLASLEDGLNLLRGCTESQVVLGLSLGGVLSLIAASRYSLKGVVAMSTPSSLPEDPRLHYLGVLSLFKPKLEKGEDDFHNPDAKQVHVSLPHTPTRSIQELAAAIDEMHRALPEIKVPALLIQSRLDRVIAPDSLENIYNHIGSQDKTRLWVENSGHVITEEPDREQVFAAASNFIQRVSG